MGAAEGLSTHDGERADRRHRSVIVWAAGGVLLLYALGGCLGVRALRKYGAETARIREARIASVTTRPQVVTPTSGAPTRGTDVKVALNLNRMGSIVVKDSIWTADFDISFRWRGDAVNPGKNFRVANGQIDQREKVAGYERGGERYEQYRVVARISKSFDGSRFPFGKDGVVLEIEDSTQGLAELRYVADESNCGVSPEAMPRRLKIERTIVGVAVRRAGAVREANSQFFLGMLVKADGVPIFLNMFSALFAAVAVALIVFFIKAIHVDPRFGLPVGGFFAAVSNNSNVTTFLPPSDRVTLAAMVNVTGLLTIFLVLVESAVSLYVLDTLGRERLSRFCDRTFFVVVLIGYVAVNVMLPLAARG